MGFKKACSACLSLVLVFTFTLMGIPQIVQGVGNTYYVDSVNGNDSNSGTSTSSPWKTLNKVNATTFTAGDKILFKAGCAWTGQLWPKGSGIAGSPIIIDMYGTGAKPLIDGNGIAGPGTGYLSTDAATVVLKNQQYWEINNLEIKNDSTTAAERRGVFITTGGTASGTFNHIYLKNLYVHDVKGRLSRDDGGIIFYTGLGSGPTNFNDVLVQDCTITNIQGNGITITSTYVNQYIGQTTPWGQFPAYNEVNWGEGDAFKWTNVKYNGNNVSNCSGDGMLIINADSPIMEYNVCSNTSYGGNAAYAGIWPHTSNDALIQYNESYNNKLVAADGQGFDVDYNCDNAIVQYNYSHDNEGGFLLLMESANYTTIRYNISQNDKVGVLDCRAGNISVYNNTFYGSAPILSPTVENGFHGTGSFKNNIFYSPKGISVLGWGNFSYSNNAYYNYSTLPSDSSMVTADPKFYSYGTGGIGRLYVNGYKLQSDSPCLNAGAVIANNGGKDYWGNAVSASAAPHIGAYNGAAVAVNPNPNTPSSPITSGSYYKIINKNSGKCVDVTGASTLNGYNIIQNTYTGASSQKWLATKVDGGYYKFINLNSGKVFCIPGSSVENGTQLVQWTDAGIADQKWMPIDRGAGYYSLVNCNSNKAMGVSGSSTSEGASIIQWTNAGIADQQWQFIPIP